jgi:hypothetical protein
MGNVLTKRTANTSTQRPPSAKRRLRPRYPEGYGVLRGQFMVRPGLDLTKPIYEQTLELDRKERRKPTR